MQRLKRFITGRDNDCRRCSSGIQCRVDVLHHDVGLMARAPDVRRGSVKFLSAASLRFFSVPCGKLHRQSSSGNGRIGLALQCSR